MEKRTGIITFAKNPLTLVGTPVAVGAKAPDFTALAPDLSPVSLSAFKGKVVIISSVPSIDTPVCDMQTRRFNEEAGKLSDAVIITISNDLPFAQARYCGDKGIDNVKTLSDHRDLSFGLQYGLVVEELRLLARAVTIIDKDGVVRYSEVVPEMTNHPDYDAALAAAKKLL
ncbi:MAG: thiol peroxidase [Sporomusaceae bacterium]|nr:thiol peroxidase [Sporomusaceae bacterium]